MSWVRHVYENSVTRTAWNPSLCVVVHVSNDLEETVPCSHRNRRMVFRRKGESISCPWSFPFIRSVQYTIFGGVRKTFTLITRVWGILFFFFPYFTSSSSFGILWGFSTYGVGNNCILNLQISHIKWFLVFDLW